MYGELQPPTSCGTLRRMTTNLGPDLGPDPETQLERLIERLHDTETSARQWETRAHQWEGRANKLEADLGAALTKSAELNRQLDQAHIALGSKIVGGQDVFGLAAEVESLTADRNQWKDLAQRWEETAIEELEQACTTQEKTRWVYVQEKHRQGPGEAAVEAQEPLVEPTQTTQEPGTVVLRRRTVDEQLSWYASELMSVAQQLHDADIHPQWIKVQSIALGVQMVADDLMEAN